MIDRSKSLNVRKSFDLGIVNMYVLMKLFISNILLGWIRIVSFLYCFFMLLFVVFFGILRIL